MLNLSRIQSELERAKEKLRNVEETIQKVEGKAFSNAPVRYGGLKNEYHSDKMRNHAATEEVKNQRRRVIASSIDSRIQRLPADDPSFGLKRGLREKRESALGLKRQGGDSRPQGVFARLSGAPFHQADEEDEDDFGKKPTLSSRVYATAAEVPSRQEVIAAQAQDEQSKERNKRMFGALVGTLQKFRKEETRVREREEKRLKVEKKLEENAKREKEKLMQEKRELFLEKKRREVEIKRIEWSLNRVKEYEAWEANVIPLKNFIQTQAKPHIFYLPSIHNAKTEERLVHSQKLVERMIEKRKTNLKEEIENSEKKARKAAAEEAEEEEAENIPEDNEESCNTEQQMQIDFEPKNKENGYFEEVKNDKADCAKDLNDASKPNNVEEEENWDVVQEHDAKGPSEVSETEVFSSSSKQETKEEVAVTVDKDWNPELGSPSGERLSDGAGEGSLNESAGGEKEMRNAVKEETEESKESKNESVNVDAKESVGESTEVNANVEPPVGESDKVGEQEPISEKSTEIIEKSSEETTAKKPLLSESEPNTEDSLRKKLDSQEEKNKTDETQKKEKPPDRKVRRRSRSPRKSRSPRNSLRNKRRRSSSRQRRVPRRLSSSNSPPKKSRRSRSPASKRGQKNLASRKRTPPGKTRRRRRSSSQSSSSVSPRKKRSRSSSSSSSNSD